MKKKRIQLFCGKRIKFFLFFVSTKFRRSDVFYILLAKKTMPRVKKNIMYFIVRGMFFVKKGFKN